MSLSTRLLRRPLLTLTPPLPIILTRTYAAGDTGSVRAGGDRHADAWSRREKAAEDLYIYEREKEIVKLLREKIAEQEARLARDRAILNAMEDQYGHVGEERTAV